MARRRESDDSDDDLDDEDEEEAPRPRKHARPPPRKKPHGHAAPVKRWKSSENDEEDAEEEPPTAPPSDRKPVYWRARDSLYFEPLVALAVIAVLVVALFAFTQNWPPIYVIESDSMQHGSSDQVGLINTGDLVLAQKVSNSSIVPYVVGMTTGFTTYGEYGDVLLYHPDGTGTTPVIHRAILFLVWDPGSRTYSAPDLNGLPCGNASNAVYYTMQPVGDPNHCATSGLNGTLSLFDLGWMSVNVTVDLTAPALGFHSGFLTMGDNNFECVAPGECTGFPDQGGTSTPVISTLVEPSWIVGVARGMIPWFGALKLLLSDQAGMVPSQSWAYLGATIIGLILLALGIHLLLRREGVETPLRREEEEERRKIDREDNVEEDSGGRHWLRSLRPWKKEEDEADDSSDRAAGTRHSATKHASGTEPRGGRPRPKVHGKDKPHAKSKRSSSDDDDEL
jgi:signal peptidase I